MPEVTLQAGRAYLVMQPDRRVDIEDLANRLRSAGISVDVQVTEYVPGRRGMSAWWLTHCEREDYNTRQEVTGRDGEPLELTGKEALDILRGVIRNNPLPDNIEEDGG